MSRFNRVWFIINPKSGKGKGRKLLDELPHAMELVGEPYEIKMTNYAGHGKEIAACAVAENIDVVVACGGDGTVNEISSQLKNSATCLAIMPLGSGNGLARHLRIPFDIKRNTALLTTGKMIAADAMEINNQFSINVSGIGFDAHVAELFSHTHGRGLLNYVRLSLREFRSFQSMDVNIIYDDKKMETKAFMVAFANSAQFGNNFKIAPEALITDEWIDLCIVAKPTWRQALQLAVGAYNGTIAYHACVQIVKVKKVKIFVQKKYALHIDGEPAGMHTWVEAKILPGACKLLVPAGENIL